MAESKFKAAAVQASAVILDRDASIEKACRLIGEAAAKGARIVAFSEAWLTGYGGHGWVEEDGPDWFNFAARYNEQAVEIPSPATDLLCETAREHDIDVVIGAVERDTRTRGTLYCTILFIGREGEIVGKHRKLKPTGGERLQWGEGAGDTLTVYDRGYARISALNCWENILPLPCFTLMAQGTELHMALWPGEEKTPAPEGPGGFWPRQHLHSRAFASSGACYVMCVGGVRRKSEVPENVQGFYGTQTGDSVIIDPRGEIVAGPLHDEEGILVAEIDIAAIRGAKAAMDSAGHYSRPDVFKLDVNGRRVFGNG
jgi:predicted amidohydrolase